MNTRATIKVPCTVHTEVSITVDLSERAIADIKANRDFDAPAIVDAKLGPNASVDLNTMRRIMTKADGAAISEAVVNAVRNGRLG
jgi:hypothetical protein